MNPAEQRKLVVSERILIAAALAGVIFAIWLAWFRPLEPRTTAVRSFQECTAAGHSVQQTAPAICVTPEGQRFVDPSEKVVLPAATSQPAAQTLEPTR